MATKGNVKSDLLPLGFEIGFVIIANLLDGTKCKWNCDEMGFGMRLAQY
jgi:hypothetical protein